MAQFARPDADQATGTWTTTPLWSKVNEGVATDDGTLISLAQNSENDNADLRLSDVTSPVAGNHIIRADWNGNGGRTTNLFCELWQGVPGTGTEIAQLTTTDPTANTDYSYTLSGAEVGNITDYSDLYFRIYYTYTGGGPPSGVNVDAVELEVPDAAAQTVQESVSDGVDLGDTATEAVTMPESASDGADFGDTADEAITMPEAASDGADLGDSVTAEVKKQHSVTDGAELGDTADFRADFADAETDGVQLGDTADARADLTDGATEGVDLGDTATEVLTMTSAASDGVDLGDSAAVDLTSVDALSDGVDMGDSATASVTLAGPGFSTLTIRFS